MKKIIKLLLAFMLITLSGIGQEINHLSDYEYKNILINGVNWLSISETKGDINKMRAYFGNDLNYETETEPILSIYIWNNCLSFRFENNSDYENEYNLVGFRIKQTSNFTIKGKTFTIGDSIDVLGTVKINSDESGVKYIVFSDSNSDSAIYIAFDQITNRVTEIKYVSFD